MENILVSAVITTYKRELFYLQKAVESILEQDYPNIELIIVDDSPADYEGRDRIKSYCQSLKENNVIYHQQPQSSGACAARNKGIELSNGQYIAFLDDDDVWCKEKISVQLRVFEDNPNVALVYGDYPIINLNNGTEMTFFSTTTPHSGMVYDEIMKTNFIGSTSVPLIKKEALMNVGCFDKEQPAMQDWDVWIRLAEKYEVAYTTEKLINYYIHKGEHITTNPDKRLNALMRFQEKHKAYLEKYKNVQAMRYHYMMRMYVRKKDAKNAFLFYRKMVSCQPGAILRNIMSLKAFIRLILPELHSNW